MKKLEIGGQGQDAVKNVVKLVKKGNGKGEKGGSRQQRTGN